MEAYFFAKINIYNILNYSFHDHIQGEPSRRLEFQLPVILSLKTVMTFMTYQKFSFLFDIYEMGRYTLEQNWEILKTYFQSDESSTQTVRNLILENLVEKKCLQRSLWINL